MNTSKNLLLEGEHSDRLLFRKVVEDDYEHWLPFYHNPKSTQYWEGLPEDPDNACNQQFQRIFERYELGLGGMNALVLKETNELVGLCGLLVQEVDQKKELEIGYSILPNHWRKGYAIEAAVKCKEFARLHQLSKSLISIIHIANIPSQKVALKNGMHLSSSTTYKNNPVHIYRLFL